jgi:undecaprenyl-diphosphatase
MEEIGMSELLQLNYTLFQAINAPAGTYSWLDSFMIFSANYLIYCWLIFLLFVWGIPLRWRKGSASQAQPGALRLLELRRAVVLWIAVACILSYALNLGIEQFVFEPRPFVSHTVHLLVTHPADSSFPSDHAAWSFAVVGMMAFAFLPLLWSNGQQLKEDTTARSRLGLLLILTAIALVIACLIGYARVFVGVHYPGDILGGAIDGLVAAGVATALRRWMYRPTHAVIQFASLLYLA